MSTLTDARLPSLKDKLLAKDSQKVEGSMVKKIIKKIKRKK